MADVTEKPKREQECSKISADIKEKSRDLSSVQADRKSTFSLEEENEREMNEAFKNAKMVSFLASIETGKDDDMRLREVGILTDIYNRKDKYHEFWSHNGKTLREIKDLFEVELKEADAMKKNFDFSPESIEKVQMAYEIRKKQFKELLDDLSKDLDVLILKSLNRRPVKW